MMMIIIVLPPLMIPPTVLPPHLYALLSLSLLSTTYTHFPHRLYAATIRTGYAHPAGLGYTQRIRVGCAIADYAQHVGSRGNGADYTQ